MQNDNEILNELRIEVAKQKENIDSLRTNVDKFESKLNELTSLIKTATEVAHFYKWVMNVA